jgi:hypothetical protein
MAKRKSMSHGSMKSDLYYHYNTLSSGYDFFFGNLSYGNDRQYRSKESKPKACRNF